MKTNADMAMRKPARRMAEIPPDVLDAINRAETDTRNLVEWLAADQWMILQAILQQQKDENALAGLHALRKELASLGVTARFNLLGDHLLKVSQEDGRMQERIRFLAAETSDFARSWAADLTGKAPGNIADKLLRMQPFAADPHYAVRETAWMSIRPAVTEALDAAIAVLQEWSLHKDPNIRRFASEVTRPRGVWCKHMAALKAEPWKALPILDPLKADPSRYVRDSVGNWLNDASRTQPEWVRTIAAQWEASAPCKETQHIIRKALRSLQ